MTESTYKRLERAHLIWGKLLAAVAFDKDFMNKVFLVASKSDDFLSRYLYLYNTYSES
jgi:hypothetical protein